MNALQQLIRDYLDDHPSMTQADVARRGGMRPQVLSSLLTRKIWKQTPKPATIAALVQAMPEISERRIRAAAASVTGAPLVATEVALDDQTQYLIAAYGDLDGRRKDELVARARFLLEEMGAEGDSSGAGQPERGGGRGMSGE